MWHLQRGTTCAFFGIPEIRISGFHVIRISDFPENRNYRFPKFRLFCPPALYGLCRFADAKFRGDDTHYRHGLEL
jgi:hypothetical protein